MINPVVVFLKAPVRSGVKTRLAETLGDDLTLELYRCFVMDILEKAEQAGCLSLCFHPAENEMLVRAFLEQWSRGKTLRWMAQNGGDLGEKMSGAFASEFENGCDKAVLIGSDIPDLPLNFIAEAFEALEHSQAVIGPSTDGGYYLIGFKRSGFSPEFFRGMAWSTPSVCEKTLEIMGKNHINCHMLPFWRDVDTGEDYEALVKRLSSGLTTAPHTWAFIQNHEKNHLGHHPRSA